MANTRIGALWLRKNDNVGQYLSGVLSDFKDDINIVAFKNKDKGEKGPDFIIYRSTDKQERKQTARQDDILVDETPGQEAEDEINVENIPFG